MFSIKDDVKISSELNPTLPSMILFLFVWNPPKISVHQSLNHSTLLKNYEELAGMACLLTEPYFACHA